MVSYKNIFNCHFFFSIVIALNGISFSFSYSLFDFQVPSMYNRQLRNTNNEKLTLQLIPHVTTLNSSFRFIEIS